ncbi:hypothetical protein GRF59_08955 [Paenibacillus sp. HJL G12]|uniref:Uncharacterized protein n=1 Tax=Paenibacillus dendrobii TaxID=2691084 RepID=A0A7X3IH93_9BACL|nr:hypothetical protein [Paenibacillus dendrobii]MWV43765.1 hypothetical protein [Paenibacillus dendrobii]
MGERYGETEIPPHPKRIVSIGMEDMLLSLVVPLDRTGGIRQLSKIASTITFNWQSGILDIGKALGKEEQAKAVLQAYQEKVKEAKERSYKLLAKRKQSHSFARR